MLNENTKRVGIAYILVQVAIWIKTALFFMWYGHGKAMYFSRSVFPENVLVFDFYFHEAMHVMIGVLALLFGLSLKKMEWLKLAAVAVAGAALHNSAYWFTATHPGLIYTLQDMAFDTALLFAFLVAGYAFKKVICRVNRG